MSNYPGVKVNKFQGTGTVAKHGKINAGSSHMVVSKYVHLRVLNMYLTSQSLSH